MHPALKILLILLTLAACGFVWLWGSIIIALTTRTEVAIPALTVFVIALPVLLFSRFKKPAALVMAAAFCIGVGYNGYHEWKMEQARKVPQMSAGDLDLDVYQPFAESNRLATPGQPATIALPAEGLPRLDGALALYPLYAAFVQAAYPPPANPASRPWESKYDRRDSSGLVAMNNTPEAYQRLIDGQTDIIFVAAPSDAQVQAAAAAGKEFKLTPIGKEAFVFFVHKDNPVDNLTVEQVKQIYSGSLKNWREVGGPDQKIRAFQRNENSGSQSTMQSIMGDTPLMKPPLEDRNQSMGGIVSVVADYRNYENALGFSFRYYTQTMLAEDQIKLLKINGIAPTRENIANNSYPFAREFYAVTTGNESPAARQFINWIRSPQGQELVDKTGYVPLDKADNSEAAASLPAENQ